MRWFFIYMAANWLLACQPTEQTPNVLIILVDDLGWNDLGYMGSTFYETPHIDALSEQSFRFTDAYSSGSVCSPSRAALMTGRHPVSLRITDWIPGQDPRDRPLLGPQDLNELPLEEVTLAEVFAEANYRTMFSGKWHLGDEGYFPEQQGFEVNKGGHHRGSPPGGYYVPYKNPMLSDGPEGEYLTDRLTDEMLQFIGEGQGAPFFTCLSFYNVHTPIQPNLDFIAHFEDKANRLALADTLTKREGEGLTVLVQYNAEYASMVKAVDENVGRIVKHLKEQGLYDRTTIIFTSDNGGLSTLDASWSRMPPTAVTPLRAGKGWLYEGGIRVPLLIKPANMAGAATTIDAPVIGHDLMPTLLSMAGIELPSTAPIEGVDLSPLLEGQEIERETLWWHYPHYHGSGWKPGAAIRQGDWKLIEFYEDPRVELYDLSEDLSEQTDLSLKMPERTRELLDKLHELQAAAGAESPRPND
ncbi:MAG: sulfatase [Bacteroidota bacterium]